MMIAIVLSSAALAWANGANDVANEKAAIARSGVATPRADDAIQTILMAWLVTLPVAALLSAGLSLVMT